MIYNFFNWVRCQIKGHHWVDAGPTGIIQYCTECPRVNYMIGP